MYHSVDNRLTALKQISQEKLIDILKRIPGNKDFIIDKSLIKPLERIIGVSLLRSHGVEKIYKLEDSMIPFTNTQRVFFIASDLITLKHVCNKINFEQTQKNDGNSYHIIFSGKQLVSLTNLLEEEGIYGTVTAHYFQWELILLDDRILSMESPNLFKSLFVEGDQSFLPCIARSIWTLSMLFGKPSVSIVHGKFSNIVQNMVKVYYEEFGTPDRADNDISYFILVDRDIDYATALLTGATYTSLLDEVYGVSSGFVEINTDKTDKKSSCLLNSTDEIYANIKNRHFSDIFPYLRMKTKELTEQYEKSLSAIQDMKRYISQHLQSATTLKKSVAYHISACEGIQNSLGHRFENLLTTVQNMLEGRSKRDSIVYIEENLAMDISDKYSVLRLMCLLSLTLDGLLSVELSSLKQQFLHKYGYQNLPLFYNLAKLNLFIEQPGLIASEMKGGHLANKVVQAVSLPTRRSTFYSNAQKLKLLSDIGDDFDLRSPKDLSYVFSGIYTPLIPQLINMILKQEINFSDLSKLLPSCSVELNDSPQKPANSFLVFCIGGITYSEVAALQLLEKLTNSLILVAGTSLVNGNKLMKSCF